MSQRRDITPEEESELIAQCKKDKRHFAILYENHFDSLFRFVYRKLGGDEETAGDLTQQTFIKAFANIDKYEERGLRFSSWLYRIAQNEVLMFFRKQKKTWHVPIDENRIKDLASEAQVNSYMTEEEQEKLIHLVNELEGTQLDLIELRFFQSLSFKEIAEIYNITEANAKMRVYRILEKIAQKWGKRT